MSASNKEQPAAMPNIAAVRVATTLNSTHLAGLDGRETIGYALAKVALEDDFADKLLGMTGAVGRDIDLEF